MRALFDVNVLVSIYGFPGRLALLLEGIDGKFEHVTSPYIVGRMVEILLRRGIEAEVAAEALLQVWNTSAVRVVPPRSLVEEALRVCSDLDDAKVIAAAVHSNANLLVTGDKFLLAVGEFEGVRIVTLEEFAKVLQLRGK